MITVPMTDTFGTIFFSFIVDSKCGKLKTTHWYASNINWWRIEQQWKKACRFMPILMTVTLNPSLGVLLVTTNITIDAKNRASMMCNMAPMDTSENLGPRKASRLSIVLSMNLLIHIAQVVVKTTTRMKKSEWSEISHFWIMSSKECCSMDVYHGISCLLQVIRNFWACLYVPSWSIFWSVVRKIVTRQNWWNDDLGHKSLVVKSSVSGF